MASVQLFVPPMRASSITPQLGVGYLASVLRAADHRVDLVHCDAAGLDSDDVVERVKRTRPDVVGLYAFSPMRYPSSPAVAYALS